jgi:hypothetical protein
MSSTRILALGEFSPKDIAVTQSPSNRKIDPTIEAKIDAVWENKKAKAEELGQNCYNGMSYRINSLKQNGDRLEIDFGTIEFKTRISLIEIPEYFSLGEEYHRMGCYAGATVKTTDGKYVMVELSGKSLNSNKIEMLGGLIEKPLEINNSDDLFLSIYSELEEEACIEKGDIDKMYLRAVYIGAKTDVGFYFEATLKLSAKELAEKFERENKDEDVSELRFYEREEYQNILKGKSENKKLVEKLLTL